MGGDTRIRQSLPRGVCRIYREAVKEPSPGFSLGRHPIDGKPCKGGGIVGAPTDPKVPSVEAQAMAVEERSESILDRDSFVVRFLSGHKSDYGLCVTRSVPPPLQGFPSKWGVYPG
jgi:hypothetical protein